MRRNNEISIKCAKDAKQPMITHDVAERSGGDKKKQNRQRANKNVQTECWIGKIIVCDNDDILNEWADKKQDNSDKIKIRMQKSSVSRIQTTRLETYPWRISIAREPTHQNRLKSL